MTAIQSYVFFDIETTGLPWEDKNRTKITELSFVATSRKDIEGSNIHCLPPVSKLTLVFNPEREIHPAAAKLTGLTNQLLKHAPVFHDKIKTIISFLEDLPKPVCLIAHNGNIFDFKILLAECNDANTSLPNDLLCVDSLVGFRKLCKGKLVNEISVQDPEVSSNDIITDDEDDWPNLDVSTEDWQEIDELCQSLSDISCDSTDSEILRHNEKVKKERSKAVHALFSKEKKTVNGYNLESLYKQLLKKDVCSSHRAEADCLALLECVIATKHNFLNWADSACKAISEIKPLKRY